MELLKSLELSDELMEACGGKSKRYTVKDGKLVEMPMGLFSFLWSGLFSFEAKKKFLMEFFIGKRKDNKEESVSSFFTRHFGDEIPEQAVDPFA